MNLSLDRISLLLGVATASLIIVSGCSTAPTPSGPISITKVNPYHLKPGMYVKTDDAMIKFEQRHHLHGAVSYDEYIEKYGNYYTVFWKSKNPGRQVTVRFEYRQAKTGATVKHIDVSATAERKNVTKFRVNGEYYKEGGPVASWRALVLEGDTVVAESKSFLWK